ncbi:MAG TPA: hypothetical protein VGE74_11720 [Gemmata sp.]
MRFLSVVGFVLVLGMLGRGADPAPTEPQTDARPSHYDGAVKLVAEAVSKLQTSGPTGFFDVAFSGSPTSLTKEDRPQVELLFGELHKRAVARCGKSTGVVEPVRTAAVGKSIVQFTYVERLERGPVFWHMLFYCGAGGEWRWGTLSASEQYVTEFRAAPVTDKEVVALAQEGVDALKEPGTAKLFDAMFSETRSLRGSDRRAAEPVFTGARESFKTRGGKPLEIEFVRTEAAGGALVRFVYMEKAERSAQVWKFSFYRTADGWKWLNMEVGGPDQELTTTP